MIPTVGRIVHYVLGEGRSKGDHRPAIIVRVWGEDQVKAGTLDPSALGTVQLQVFTDTAPDGGYNDELPPVMWKSSVAHDENAGPGTWHWTERVEPAAGATETVGTAGPATITNTELTTS